MNLELHDHVTIIHGEFRGERGYVCDEYHGRYGHRVQVQMDHDTVWLFISEVDDTGFDKIRQCINAYDQLQTVVIDGTNGQEFPVCSSCHAMVMPNRGEGTVCDSCNDNFLLHCAHDDWF